MQLYKIQHAGQIQGRRPFEVSLIITMLSIVTISLFALLGHVNLSGHVPSYFAVVISAVVVHNYHPFDVTKSRSLQERHLQ